MSARVLTSLAATFGRFSVLVAISMVTALAAPAGLKDGVASAHVGQSNPVTEWNSIADAAFTPSQGTNPMAQSRTLAILHAAIHDAINAIPSLHLPDPDPASHPNPSPSWSYRSVYLDRRRTQTRISRARGRYRC